MKLRHTLLLVHRYIGVGAGLLILVTSVTGAVLVFNQDIDRALNPDLLTVTPQAAVLPLETLVARVRAVYPDDQFLEIRVPPQPDQAAAIGLRRRPIVAVYIDQYTGRVLGERGVTSPLIQKVNQLHTGRLAGPAGRTVVWVGTSIALLGVLIGLYLWWPLKIVWLRGRRTWRWITFDLHSMLGLFSSALLVVILASGLMITFEAPIESALVGLLDPPAAPEQPPVSTVVSGARRLTLDEAVAIADRALPGAFTVGVNTSLRPTDTFQVLKRFPEDKTGGGRSRVWIDQYSGAILRVASSRDAGLGTKIINAIEPVHFGTIYGWPTVLFAFLATVSLAGQVITGFLIWWRPAARPARRATGAAPVRPGA